MRRAWNGSTPIFLPSRPICAVPSRIERARPHWSKRMADALLKFPDAAERPASAKRASLKDLLRKNLRMILLVGVPTIAAVAGFGFYLSGGRYISTDNAYV